VTSRLDADVPGADAPGADAHEADAHEADVPDADVPDADVVVVGSGAAGIATALTAAACGLRVVVVTKDLIGGATPLAQGGLAAALGPADSAASHVADTLMAGAGLCEADVVAALADAAPAAIDWLVGLGAELDRSALRLEGGHTHHRIVHSGNDATGAEVHRALLAALLASRIEIRDRTIALDVLVQDATARIPVSAQYESADGGTGGTGIGTRPWVTGGLAAANVSSPAPVPVPVRAGSQPGAAGEPGASGGAGEPGGRLVTGIVTATIGAGGALSPAVLTARAVVLAAGGLGQVFGTTSNPAGATGDSIVIAARAGAALRDLEFVQFHPTVLWLPGASGQCPLITEALRGAGAVLRDLDGQPLMAGHHPRGDLAPRDVVAARIHEVITAAGGEHVWLDATALGREALEDGFPTVTAACRKYGIDPVTEYIPVAPGAHYSCGGVLADLAGRTTIGGLYAVGEAASTGVQGANRLASNSVTEAVIVGRRAGEAIAEALYGAVITEALDGAADRWSGASAGEVADGGTTASEGTDRARISQRGNFSPLSGGKSSAVGKSSAMMRLREALPVASEDSGADGGVPGRQELAASMSRLAGVLRDHDGLEQLVRTLGGTGGVPAGLRARDGYASGGADVGVAGGGAERAGWGAAALVPHDGDGVDLESVEAANLRVVSWLIAVAALRRAESRGCHRRRDAAGTAERAWHTLMRWDGEQLVVREETL
jgi:aspartate oxidase